MGELSGKKRGRPLGLGGIVEKILSLWPPVRGKLELGEA